jgi:Rod binding domain-containing protein
MDPLNPISDRPIEPLALIQTATRIDPQDRSGNVEAVQNPSAEQQRRVRLAKDFESILMTRMLDEMKNTIGEWDDSEDAASQQMQGIFWMHLAQHVGGNGGIGLWKQIVQSMNQSDPIDMIDSSVDEPL